MRSKFIISLFVIVIGLIILGGFFILRDKNSFLSNNVSQVLPVIKVNNVSIDVELANTPEEQARGLSGKTILPKNQGMLFLYNEPGFYSFWMKDMRFSIDIIWINRNYKIVDITKNIPPESFPNNFRPSLPAQYVLEVNAGFVDKNNISIDDRVDFLEVFPAQKFKELIFVEDAENDKVIVLSKDGDVVKEITVGHAPHDIAASPDGRFIATANFSSGNISVINGETLLLEKTILTGKGTHGLVFDPSGMFLYVVSSFDDKLSVLSVPSFEVLQEVQVGDYPEYVGVTNDGSSVFTTNIGNGGSITVLQNNGGKLQVTQDISSDVDPHGWAVSPDGSRIIITTLGSNSVYLYDSSNFEEINHLDTGATSEFASFLTDNEVWITNIGARYISIVDVKKNEVLERVEVGETPHGISFSTDKTLAFVPLYEPGEVVIIDISERKIIKRIKVGDELHNSVVVQINKN